MFNYHLLMNTDYHYNVWIGFQTSLSNVLLIWRKQCCKFYITFLQIYTSILSFAWKRYPLNLITNLQTASRAFSNVLLCLNLVQICRRLAHWYISVIRTVLDYCAVVWHHGLSKNQTESIGAIQRRALRIVYSIYALLGGTSLCWPSVSFR